VAGGGTAVYNSSGPPYYRHADWPGSSRLGSTPSRTVYYDGAYAPHGENYAETGTTDRSFTGQNQDMVPSGSYPLYDFLMREYNATWGRWISPDPAGLAAVDITNPQTWNRYAYAINNPLGLVDRLGLDNDCGGPCVPFIIPLPNSCYAGWRRANLCDQSLKGRLAESAGSAVVAHWSLG
jgi:RHS repeat-associated protein